MDHKKSQSPKVKRFSSGSSGQVEGGGVRNIKSMRPPSAAIFYMIYFRGPEGWSPCPPSLDPLLVLIPIGGKRFAEPILFFITKQ